jgi:hypothetical protein
MNPIKLCLIILSAATLAACGGGGGGTSGGTQTTYKTANLSFKTVSSSHSAPLQAIQMTVKLPQGATVADISRALTGNNAIGQIDYGSVAYSAADNTASFSIIMAAGGTSIKFGTVADLKCDITPNSILDANSFTSLNNPSFPSLVMMGVSEGNTVNLVPELKIDMTVQLQ